MARPKKETPQEPLEKQLWSAADKLRKNLDAADYKHVVLGLIFLKYISDSFESLRAQLLEGKGEFEGADPEDRDEYKAKNVFFVPRAARWNWLRDNARKPDIGVLVDAAMDAIEKDNPALKGVLPKVYARDNLDPATLGALIDLVSGIALGDAKARSADVLGHVFEYFLGEFALAEGKKGGQFYTPRSIVELLVAMLEPFKGRVMDPCCGSGGMFVQSEKFVREHRGRIRDISIYGQESNQTTWRLAKMNLAMRGISHHLGDCAKSTFEKDHHAGLAFDYIMANPPFNLKHWFKAGITEGVNWADYGTPPESNANYAWILHMLSKIKADKGIAGFLLANGALGDEDAQAIRQKLIEKDKVEAIIVLPRELFYTTDISVTLWILNQNKKGGLHHGRRLRDRTGEILFMDLRSWTENPVKGEQKKKVEIKPEQVERAKEIYFRWQQEGTDGETYAEPELYRSVGLKELGDNNYSLVPSRYIEFVDRDKSIDYDRVLSETAVAVGEMIELQKQNQDALAEAFTALGYALHK